jgi:hypothetical protein
LLLLQPVTSYAATRNVTVEGLFAAAKSNSNDRNLTRDELKRYPKLAAIVSKQLAKGHVTKSEVEDAYKAHRARNLSAFKTIDANRDGKVTYSEVALRAPALAKAFTHLDQGAKGYLLPSDFFSRSFVLSFSFPITSGKTTFADGTNAILANASPHGQLRDGEVTAGEDGFSLPTDAMSDGAGQVDELLPEGVISWEQFVAGAGDGNILSGPVAKAKTNALCVVDENGDCVTIVVTPGPDEDDGGGPSGPLDIFNPFGPIVVLDPIEVSAGVDSETFKKLFKTVRLFCKRSDETCAEWGSRMAASVCGRGAYVSTATVCNISVQEEIQAGCVNLVSC